MQGMEFHVNARQDSPAAVGAGGIDKVDSDAGAGIDDEAVGVGVKPPGSASRGDAVGPQGLGGGVVDGDGQLRGVRKQMHRAPGKGKGTQVGIARGAYDGSLPRHLPAEVGKPLSGGDTVVRQCVLMEEGPLGTGVAYVEGQVHLL